MKWVYSKQTWSWKETFKQSNTVMQPRMQWGQMARMMLDCQCLQSGSCGRSGPVRATVVSASTPITYYTPACCASYVHIKIPTSIAIQSPIDCCIPVTVCGVV